MIATSIASSKNMTQLNEEHRAIQEDFANVLMNSENGDDKSSSDCSSQGTTDISDCENDHQIKTEEGEEEEFDLTTPVKPKRALNAYNLFFRHERALLLMEANKEKQSISSSFEAMISKKDDNKNMRLKKIRHVLKNNPFQIDEGRRRPHRKTHGKVGFRDLARHIADSWKSADDDTRSLFTELAAEDLGRHRKELAKYKLRLERKKSIEETIKLESNDFQTDFPVPSVRVHEPHTQNEKRKTTKNSRKRKSCGDVKPAHLEPKEKKQYISANNNNSTTNTTTNTTNNSIHAPGLLDHLHDALLLLDEEKPAMADLDAEIFGCSQDQDFMNIPLPPPSLPPSLPPPVVSNCDYSSVPDLVSQKEAVELKDFLSALDWNLFEISHKDFTKPTCV